MPLAVGTLVAPVQVAVAGLARLQVWRDWPSATWIDPTGREWPLTDPARVAQGGPGWFTPSPGPAGLGVTPRTIAADKRDRGGVFVRRVQRDPRTVTWPLYVEGDDHAEFVGRWRALADAFSMTADLGPGRLVLARPDGSAREILAVYASGFDNDPERGIRWDVATPSLLCPTGVWRDTTPVPVLRRGPAGSRSYLTRFPRVSSSQTLGAVEVVNPGEIAAWPVWKVTGPAGSVTATSVTRGESWVVDFASYTGAPLGAGLVAYVNTETGQVLGPVDGPDGSKDWAGAVTWTTSVMWPLVRGTNKINFAVSGDGPATAIEAYFYAEYDTP